MNHVFLMGRIGSEIDIKENLAKFSFCTKERDKTTWHKIEAWNQLAIFSEKHLKKGMPLLIEGKINNETYFDKEGNKKFSTSITVNNFRFLPTNSALSDEQVNERLRQLSSEIEL